MKWTNEQLKELKDNYDYYILHKEKAEDKFQRSWNTITSKASTSKITSFEKNKKCSMFLGCHVAERVLSHIFKDVQRMPNRNRGFDFICNRGFKIDVKASCLHKNNTYTFVTKYNKIADYFLLITFDGIETLNPQHIWLIKSNEIMNVYNRKLNEFNYLTITNTKYGLSKYSKYELTDKLQETIKCCDSLKRLRE